MRLRPHGAEQPVTKKTLGIIQRSPASGVYLVGSGSVCRFLKLETPADGKLVRADRVVRSAFCLQRRGADGHIIFNNGTFWRRQSVSFSTVTTRARTSESQENSAGMQRGDELPWHMPAKAKIFSVEPRIRINYGKLFAFGPGKADLLEHIVRTGSISEAAKAMDMSYMKAWILVKSLDRAFAEPLVIKSRGGNTRGGATLSETGMLVLKAYREIEVACLAASEKAGRPLLRLLKS